MGKDQETVAQALLFACYELEYPERVNVARRFACYMAMHNKKFDTAAFFKYIGLEK